MEKRWWERHILLDTRKLTSVAATFANAEMKAPDWRAPVFLPEDDETFVQFLGIGNALNFCFTDPKSGEKFATEWRGQRWTGAFGMWAALCRALENGRGILDPAKLQSFTAADVARIFEPVPGSPPLPLIRERAMQLQNVGTVLAQRFGGSFARLFDACGFEAQKIVETLATFFPAYGCDRWTHPVTKEQIVFDKRARLLPLMYEGRARASKSRLSTLRNIERVGPVADYEIPRALRHLDVLAYAKPLAKAIDGGILLPSGSEEELAIRHVTCLAMIALLHVVNAQRERPITMVELDYAVWSQGRKSNGRHHLTLTTAY